MINADRTITIFNLRYDKESRREVFLPTCIAGVSFEALIKTQDASGVRTEESGYKIRIPIDASIQSDRTYIGEQQYAKLTGEEAAEHWTLQTGCYICAGAISSTESTTMPKDELDRMEDAGTLESPLLTVTEYADNTKRGSSAVRHWRIGAA